MQSTGIVRRLDDLGRIVIPIEVRRNLHLNEKDALEVFTDEDQVVLKKHEVSCCICNKETNQRNLTMFKGKFVCSKCVSELPSEGVEVKDIETQEVTNSNVADVEVFKK